MLEDIETVKRRRFLAKIGAKENLALFLTHTLTETKTVSF